MLNSPVTDLLIKPSARLWFHAVLITLFTLIILFLYYLLIGSEITLKTVNQIIADAGMLVIGLSFGLSGFNYYFNFVGKLMPLRRDLGLIGFYLIALHGYLSAFGLPQLFPFPAYYLRSDNIIPFIFALISFLYFAFMALISTQWWIKKLGPLKWRFLLRLGYLAYFFGFLHFAIKKYPIWLRWIQAEIHFLPPASLLIALFVIFIFALRLFLAKDISHQLPQNSL